MAILEILGLVSGVSKAISGVSDVIGTITSKIADAKIAAINAATEKERIEAGEHVKSLEAQRDVLIKSLEARASLQSDESKVSTLNIIVRTFFALPIGVLLWKVFVWDKAFGQWTGGRTDALDANLWQVVTVVIGFYFLYEGAVGITRLIRQR